MLPCDGCAYRRSIPGNCHSQCAFNWRGHVDLLVQVTSKASERGIQGGWFRFPYNYDPTWGPNECPARAEAADPEQVHEFSPMEQLVALLG